MAEESTIKEWLVKLGIKVDEQGLKKAMGALDEFALSITKIGGIITTTAIAFEAGMVRIAGQMQDLYFAAQRTGGTVEKLEALKYAADQVGMTGDAIQAATINLHDLLQTSPQLDGMFRSLANWTGPGKPVDNAGKALIDFSKAMYDMIQQGAGSAAVAKTFMDMFGVSMDTVQKLGSPEGYAKASDALADYTARLRESGIDTEAYAARSENFMARLTRLWSELDIVVAPVVNDMLRWTKPLVDGLTDALRWMARFEASLEGWAKTLLDISLAFITTITGLGALELSLSVIGVNLGIVGGLWTGFWALVSNPIGWVIGAILAVGLAVYEIWDHWEWLKKQFLGWYDELKGSINSFLSDPDGPKKLGNWIVDQIESAWSAFWDFMTKPRPELTAWLTGNNEAIKGKLGEGLIAALKWAWNTLIPFLLDLGESLVQTAFDIATKLTADLGTALVADLKGIWKGMLDYAETWGGQFIHKLWTGMLSGLDWLKQNVDSAFNWMNPFSDAAAKPGDSGGPGVGQPLSGAGHGQSAPGDGGGLMDAQGNWLGGKKGAMPGGSSWGKDVDPKTARHVYDFLLKAGYSAAQAAGILGNLVQESGLDPNAYNAAEGAVGIAQWENDRRRDLVNFAKQNKLNPYDIDTQLKFLMFEMQGKESAANARIKAETTAAGAARADQESYERSAPGSLGARIGLANYWGKKMQEPLASDGKSLSAPQVSITQKTDIHVSGSGDPHDTARQVASAQGRVNGDMVRNLSSKQVFAHGVQR